MMTRLIMAAAAAAAAAHMLPANAAVRAMHTTSIYIM
jgi:hypothetical protein